MTTPAPAPGAHASSLASVSYDASAPLNEDVRAALQATTLAQFLEERPRSGRPITLDVDATVGDAMEVRWRAQRSAAASRCDASTFFLGFHGARAAQVLARNRISSAPVLSASGAGAAPFYGFVDVPTVIDAFFKGGSAPTRAPQNEGFAGRTKEGRSLACVLAKASALACVCSLQGRVSDTRVRARCQGCPGPVRR
jgi:hypothetical protein